VSLVHVVAELPPSAEAARPSSRGNHHSRSVRTGHARASGAMNAPTRQIVLNLLSKLDQVHPAKRRDLAEGRMVPRPADQYLSRQGHRLRYRRG